MSVGGNLCANDVRSMAYINLDAFSFRSKTYQNLYQAGGHIIRPREESIPKLTLGAHFH